MIQEPDGSPELETERPSDTGRIAAVALIEQLKELERRHQDISEEVKELQEFMSSDSFLSPRPQDRHTFMSLASNCRSLLMTPLGLETFYSEKLGRMMCKYQDAFALVSSRPELRASYRNKFRHDFPVTLKAVTNVVEGEARHRRAFLMRAIAELVEAAGQ